MDFLMRLAEERIRDAEEKGDLKNLPGSGQPLKRDELENVPEDLRMGYRILQNAGMVPEEVQANKEIVALRDLLKTCQTSEEKAAVQKKLDEKTLRFNQMKEQRRFKNSKAFRQYEHKFNKF